MSTLVFPMAAGHFCMGNPCIICFPKELPPEAKRVLHEKAWELYGDDSPEKARAWRAVLSMKGAQE